VMPFCIEDTHVLSVLSAFRAPENGQERSTGR
jgi:hypothetical protein